MSSDDGKSSVELSKKTVGELKRLRGTLKSRITLLQKFVVKIDSDSLTPLQITELEIRLQSAKDTFNEFNNIQNKIELLVEESELDEHLEYRDIFESLYYSVSAVVQQLIKPVKDSESLDTYSGHEAIQAVFVDVINNSTLQRESRAPGCRAPRPRWGRLAKVPP
ncbi:hypothetical protein ACJJTC_001621 [Scirpophaga incertulas]